MEESLWRFRHRLSFWFRTNDWMEYYWIEWNIVI